VAAAGAAVVVVVGVWDRDFALSDVEGWFGVFRKESRKAS